MTSSVFYTNVPSEELYDVKSITLNLDDENSDINSVMTDDETAVSVPDGEMPKAIVIDSPQSISQNITTDSDNHETSSGISVGLMEKIVRSYPIWFLPHVSRQQAAHMLRLQPAGVFMVRQSTNQHCMALTMKVQVRKSPSNSFVDHFLIETTRAGLRLECSPNFFASLPYLLEHYHQTAEELQCCLRLPDSVSKCANRPELLRIALLGQDFWSTELINNQSIPNQSINSTDIMSTSVHTTPSSLKKPAVRKSTSNREQLCDLATRSVSPYAASPLPRSHTTDNGLCASSKGRPSVNAVSPRFLSERRAKPTNRSIENPNYQATSRLPIARNSPLRDHSHSNSPQHRLFNSSDLPSSMTSAISENHLNFANGSNHNPTNSSPSGTLKPPVRPKPAGLIFRREKSDLGFVPIKNYSPKQQINRLDQSLNRPNALNVNPSQSATWQPSRTAHLNHGNSPAAQSGSPRSYRDCVQEMRVKRLLDLFESPKKSRYVSDPRFGASPNNVPTYISRADGSPHVIRRMTTDNHRYQNQSINNQSINNTLSGNRSNQQYRPTDLPLNNQNHRNHFGHQQQSIIDNQDDRLMKSERRLSAPNLDEQIMEWRIDLDKLENNTLQEDTYNLPTINEGLVTPLMRRKEFVHRQRELKNNNQNNKMSTQAVQPQPPMQLQQIHSFNPHIRSGSSDSDSDQPMSMQRNQTASVNSTNQSINQFHRLNANHANDRIWSAVTNELKNRQMKNVAKVQPTIKQVVKSPQADSNSDYVRVHDLGGNAANQSATGTKQSHRLLAVNTPMMKRLSSNINKNNSNIVIAQKDDDQLSTAGTVFNEPWDSALWENLIDLASYGDMSSGGCIQPISEENGQCSLAERHPSTNHDKEQTPTAAENMNYGSVSSKTALVPNGTLLENQASPVNGRLSMLPRKQSTRSRTDAENNVSSVASSSASSQSPPQIHSSQPISVEEIDQLSSSSTANSYCTCDTGDEMNESAVFANTLSGHHLIHLSHNRKLGQQEKAATRIQENVKKLSLDESTIFGRTVQQFIRCTLEAGDDDPYVQMRNVRQFVSGIKNYLVKHGESDLREVIERERGRLAAHEFLNIDTILERVMHDVVLAPIKPHLYHLLYREHKKSGSVKVLTQNLAQLRNLSNEELAVGMKSIPSNQTIELVRSHLRKMQYHYSPLLKLEHLLASVNLCEQHPNLDKEPISNENLNNSESHNHHLSKSQSCKTLTPSTLPQADELVHILVFIIVKCSFVGCELEASYMWDLLPPTLLAGEASYYLTALFSAIHVLKTTDTQTDVLNANATCVSVTPNKASKHHTKHNSNVSEQKTPGSLKSTKSAMSVASSTASSQGSAWSNAFLQVAVPDELRGTIRHHTLPAGNHMSTDKLCRIIARQFAITNPEDHGLYLLIDGLETAVLAASDVPDHIREQLRAAHKEHMFAYKRHDAKIAWPKISASPAF